MAVKYKVCVIESERGWGQKREYEYFDTAEKAIEYRDRINANNTAASAPDWYMVAEQEIRIVEV
jgi:hypothetical protein